MTDQTQRDQLDSELLQCASDLIGRIVRQGDRLAQRLGIPAPFIKALHVMDCPMAMKDLGKRMHCDPSFVTLVADMLEKRGLARREAHPADRRVKNLVLTDDGLSLKQRLEAEVAARMPWNRGLTDDERAQLLALIRKMLSADAEDDDTATPAADSPGPDAMDALPGIGEMIAATLREHAPDAFARQSPGTGGGGEQIRE
jgi:MarR family transcriptional regulator, organic hydroperoxide resistance regulator